MEINYRECLEFVLGCEGGFVNDPLDSGGATNFGITISVLRAWRGKETSVDDVRRLTTSEAAQIYHASYWLASYCNNLPHGVDLLVFDAAVNMGVEPSLNLLREQIGIAPTLRRHQRGHRARAYPRMDRHLRAATEKLLLSMLRQINVPSVICGICERRRHYYKSLQNFDVYGRGWLKRVDLAQSMATRLSAVGGKNIPLVVGTVVSRRHRHRSATP